MHGYTHDKDAYLKRLRRIEGQVRGLQRMIDEDKYCIDTLTQVSAATRAPQSVALGLLEEHLSRYGTQALVTTELENLPGVASVTVDLVPEGVSCVTVPATGRWTRTRSARRSTRPAGT
jgi:DNA-binding FrmR family transcriptional regulator